MSRTTRMFEAYTPDVEQCAFPVFVDVDGYTMYPCPDKLWAIHFPAWQKARRTMPRSAVVEPMPAGHCMFERPRDYGIRSYGNNDPKLIRRAHRARTVAMLNGWDRDLRQSSDGMRRLATIVRATVRAKMQGTETGGTPFLLCLLD